MQPRGGEFLFVVLALLGVWLTQVSAQDLNFNQNNISVVITVASARCPLSNDSSVASLRQRIATNYRVALSEVVLSGCSNLRIRCIVNGTPI